MKNALLRLKQFAEFEGNADEQLFIDIFENTGEWLWSIYKDECEYSLTQLYIYLMNCVNSNPNHMEDLVKLSNYLDK